jgi:hypothetical protein
MRSLLRHMLVVKMARCCEKCCDTRGLEASLHVKHWGIGEAVGWCFDCCHSSCSSQRRWFCGWRRDENGTGVVRTLAQAMAVTVTHFDVGDGDSRSNRVDG